MLLLSYIKEENEMKEIIEELKVTLGILIEENKDKEHYLAIKENVIQDLKASLRNKDQMVLELKARLYDIELKETNNLTL